MKILELRARSGAAHRHQYPIHTAMVIKMNSRTSIMRNRGVTKRYHLFRGTPPIRPQHRAQEVGQKQSAKPLPN